IGGRVVNDLSPKERDIAMVFQNYALYPHLSVAENIAFGLRLRKERKDVINERVEWAAKLLDLTPYLDRRPKELSGGQRQRVAMGRAIVRQPQAFLMDEPLSNLDAKLRVQMRAEIARLQQDLGVTTVYVTHDQVEAMTMGNRVAVMRKGELQQLADAQLTPDRPAEHRIRGKVELTEALGSEIMVHFSVDARPALTEDVRELAEDVGRDRPVQEGAAGTATLVGRFGARSRVRVGE